METLNFALPSLPGIDITPLANTLTPEQMKAWDIRELMVNLDWHWKAVKDSTSSVNISVNGIVIYESDKSYSIMTCLYELVKAGLDSDENAFKMLLNGQRHNPPVQQQYKLCRAFLGAKGFWTTVCRTAIYKSSNHAGDKANIGWQKHENSTSIQKAKSAFSVGNEVAGMYWLMWGQRHNPGVMEGYRASFRDKPQDLIALL